LHRGLIACAGCVAAISVEDQDTEKLVVLIELRDPRLETKSVKMMTLAQDHLVDLALKMPKFVTYGLLHGRPESPTVNKWLTLSCFDV
jgi:hypothetical protein